MPLTDEAKKRARIFALKWNVENPIDFIWRKEFSVPFGSEQHLLVDVIDQQIWYEEKQLLKELTDNPDAKFDSDGRVIIQDKDGFGMTQDEIDQEFEDMDIKELQKKYNG